MNEFAQEVKAAIVRELSEFLLLNKRPDSIVIMVRYRESMARLVISEEDLDNIFEGVKQ